MQFNYRSNLYNTMYIRNGDIPIVIFSRPVTEIQNCSGTKTTENVKRFHVHATKNACRISLYFAWRASGAIQIITSFTIFDSSPMPSFDSCDLFVLITFVISLPDDRFLSVHVLTHSHLI